MTTKCAGLNCTSTDGTNHSPECRAEHAAAVAGGRFVKLPRGEDGARDEREAFEAFMQASTSRSIIRDSHGFYVDFVAYEWWKVWQARAALSARASEAVAGGGMPSENVETTTDKGSMRRIKTLIDQLQSIHDRFGNTCVYIRDGGLSWGAVALNYRDDDNTAPPAAKKGE